MKRNSRNYGIDLMRVISIIGVVFLHVLGHGGVLGAAAKSPVSFSATWLLELMCYPAVNCFVFISGFVGYKGARCFPKIKTFMSLFFTVLFYSVAITLLFKVIMPSSVGMGALVKAFLPVTTNQYWFFTAYVGMFLLSPLLNKCVQTLRGRQACILLAVVALFSGMSLFNDPFSLLKGYSVIWFALMYVVGAIFKKFDVASLLPKWGWGAVALGAIGVTWLSKVVLYHSNVSFLFSRNDILVSYASPTVMIAAVGLVCLFSKVTIKPAFSKAIDFFAVSSFSVYLIHDNTLVRRYLMSCVSDYIGGYNIVILVLCVIGIVAGIFVVCTLIDKMRILLFRLVRTDRLAGWIDSLVKTISDKLYVAIKTKVCSNHK